MPTNTRTYETVLSLLDEAVRLNNCHAEVELRAELAALNQHHRLASPPKRGERLQVVYPYGQRSAGQMGTVVSSWLDPRGNVWARLELGRNATGQPIRNVYPGNVLRLVKEGSNE